MRLADAVPGIPFSRQTVHYRFSDVASGRPRRAHDRPREALREAEGREPDPSAAVIDGQAVKGSGVGGTERGYDGAKRLSGRRHRSWTPAGSRLARVHTEKIHDRDGARRLLSDESKSE